MFAEGDIVTSEALASLRPAEDILMVGYPIGLFNEKHNLLVVRQGITASDPQIPYGDKIIS